jgi:atypical dual specificity phosphatase
VDPSVLLGARPLAKDVEALSLLGVKAIVNTCEEFAGHIALYEKFGIRQLHIPTTDFQPPALEQIETAVQFMDDTIAGNGKVYVHCKAGRARSATVVMCWMIHSRQMTASEAQQQLLKYRPHVNPNLSKREVVQQYEAIHAK